MAPEPLRWILRILCIPLLLAAGPLPAEEIETETRIDGLEARLEGLTRRVQALESLLKEAGRGNASVSTPKGEPAWELDDCSRESPFQVIQRSLDRETGRVDLLLSVTAAIPDLASWAAVTKGDPVPLLLTPDLGDGGPAVPLPLRLERATRLEPGSRVHVSAQLEPGIATRVRLLRVGQTAPAGTDPGAGQ